MRTVRPMPFSTPVVWFAVGTALLAARSGPARAADDLLPPRAPARDSRPMRGDANREDEGAYFPAPRTPAPPPIPEEVLPPDRPAACRERRNPFYYLRHTLNRGAADRHHEKWWHFRDGTHHGYPYGCSSYAGRAVGASYHLPEWTPRRSVYYAYQPGYSDLPYGFSPEPYYGPVP